MISIEKGSVLIYRVFDIAEEIDLHKVELLLKSESSRSRLRFTLPPRQVVIMRNAPVTLSMGESEVVLHDRSFKAEVFAKIWDYGVLSLMFQIAIPAGATWESLVDIASRIEIDTLIDESIT
ncbi:MAG: hypothetical protein EBX52_05095 [Proteobacteria bacterium]|nr:hypothetical protein [Pseudomonadota bacterium]